MTSETYWWTGTALDLTYLGAENISRLATLAGTPSSFYLKYVQSNQAQKLMQDVLALLNTTEDYARDFATRVIQYFQTTWIQNNPIPLPQLPPATNLPVPPTQPPSRYTSITTNLPAPTSTFTYTAPTNQIPTPTVQPQIQNLTPPVPQPV